MSLAEIWYKKFQKSVAGDGKELSDNMRFEKLYREGQDKRYYIVLGHRNMLMLVKSIVDSEKKTQPKKVGKRILSDFGWYKS